MPNSRSFAMATSWSLRLAIECRIPRSSSVSSRWTTWGRSFTSRSSRRMPSQTVSSRSQTTHLMDCFSFFFAACTAAAWVVAGSEIMASELLKLEQRNGDLLDLRATLDDLHDLGVAQVAAHGIVLAAAVGAVDLHRVVGGADGQPRGEVLGGHGLHEGPRIAGFAQPAGTQAEQAGGAHVDDHVRQQAADELVVGERRAALPALLGVRAAGVETRLGDAHRAPGDAVAPLLQRRRGDVRDAEADAAHQALLGHAAAGELDLRQHRGARAE